ncbi:hypothetical protein, partial [Vibrio parahaemolyticus]|uniref:hypothetical protein n=1 Tax=Vibrio parahaemolyticus TaxID=670 RepID=UPI001BAF31D3
NKKQQSYSLNSSIRGKACLVSGRFFRRKPFYLKSIAETGLNEGKFFGYFPYYSQKTKSSWNKTKNSYFV